MIPFGWPVEAREKTENEGFDVIHAGCTLDRRSDQLDIFLTTLGKSGTAVFSYGLSNASARVVRSRPDDADINQSMWLVSTSGRCEILAVVDLPPCDIYVSLRN